jgi:hypothetical protein
MSPIFAAVSGRTLFVKESIGDLQREAIYPLRFESVAEPSLARTATFWL